MLSHLHQAEHFVIHGQFLQAEEIYRQLLAENKSNGSAYLGLGIIALAMDQYDSAVSLLTQACHLLPNISGPLLQLAKAFNGVCSEQDALTVLNYAQTRFPDSAEVHYQLAQQHLILGNLESAENALRTVIAIDTGPIVTHALFELVRCGCSNSLDVTCIKQRVQDQLVVESELIVLHYALGNIYHEAQDYAASWQHFSHANRLQLKGCDFTSKALKPFYDKIKQVSTPSLLSQQRTAVEDELTPIFILGLPRSGSTLLEQMLARHPNVAAAGELPYLSREVDQYLYQQTGNHYPTSMQDLSAEQMQQAATLYLISLKRHAGNKPFVIDKLPANFQSIGLIYKLFPKAKVIHIRRHPPAVAFSVFKNYFAENEPYFCSLSEFKDYQNFYLDLMDHWHRVIPDYILDINYHDLVKRKEQTIQAILAFCGLDWNNACLIHKQEHAPVKTLSNIQVRQPIMTTIDIDWLPYEAHLQAF